MTSDTLAEAADVVIFTPAARKGVPLCADPIRIDPDQLNARERIHALTATATMVASLLGYDEVSTQVHLRMQNTCVKY